MDVMWVLTTSVRQPDDGDTIKLINTDVTASKVSNVSSVLMTTML
jgi:hypothetical protein